MHFFFVNMHCFGEQKGLWGAVLVDWWRLFLSGLRFNPAAIWGWLLVFASVWLHTVDMKGVVANCWLVFVGGWLHTAGVGGVDCGSKALVFVVIWLRIAATFEGNCGTILSCVEGDVDFMLWEGWECCIGLTPRVEGAESTVELWRVNAGDDSFVEGGFDFVFSDDRMNTRTSSHSMPGIYVKSMLAQSSISLKVKRV